MNRFRIAFTEHPGSVGETYWQHMGTALSFAGTLLMAAMAALVHAVFPFLLVKTGSAAIQRLHDRMVVQRSSLRHRASPSDDQRGSV